MEIEVSGLHLMCDKVFIDASSDSKVVCRNVDFCSHGCSENKYPYSINDQVTVSMILYRNSR